eukprot:PhF_6_TR36287/c1_g1_i9/m.52912
MARRTFYRGLAPTTLRYPKNPTLKFALFSHRFCLLHATLWRGTVPTSTTLNVIRFSVRSRHGTGVPRSTEVLHFAMLPFKGSPWDFVYPYSHNTTPCTYTQ